MSNTNVKPLLEFLDIDYNAMEGAVHQLGYRAIEPISAGMEGILFDIGNNSLVKCWYWKSVEEICALQNFYGNLLNHQLPFHTPEIMRVENVHNIAVSVERKLPGSPMPTFLDIEDEEVPDFASEVMIVILDALSKIHLEVALPVLRLQQERDSMSWIDMMLNQLDIKVGQFGDQLEQSVDGFRDVYEKIRCDLASISQPTPSLIHGDLVPANILLDSDGRLSAVLDWGLLTMAGDPAFEAGVSAGIYNIYGSHAPNITSTLMGLYAEKFHYRLERMTLYLALFALLKSNFYSSGGKDGQYAWSVWVLNRADVRQVLGLSL